MHSAYEFFAGIDWGTEKHRVCLMNREGRTLAERWIEHSGNSLAELTAWFRQQTSDSPSALVVAIEIPRGAVVETLLERLSDARLVTLGEGTAQVAHEVLIR